MVVVVIVACYSESPMHLLLSCLQNRAAIDQCDASSQRNIRITVRKMEWGRAGKPEGEKEEEGGRAREEGRKMAGDACISTPD